MIGRMTTACSILLALALSSRLSAASCETCKDKGSAPCVVCSGVGSFHGWCGFCKGTGRHLCPQCRGSKRVACKRAGPDCPRCKGDDSTPCTRCKDGFGTCWTCKGKPESAACTACGGRRELPCPTCGKAPASCARCQGKKQVGCPVCKGKGTLSSDCLACGGSKQAPCDECDGGEFVLCMECRGMGNKSSIDKRGETVTTPCSKCRKTGLLSCPGCKGRVLAPCKVCAGKPEATQPCFACGGQKSLTCWSCAPVPHWSGTRGEIAVDCFLLDTVDPVLAGAMRCEFGPNAVFYQAFVDMRRSGGPARRAGWCPGVNLALGAGGGEARWRQIVESERQPGPFSPWAQPFTRTVLAREVASPGTVGSFVFAAQGPAGAPWASFFSDAEASAGRVELAPSDATWWEWYRLAALSRPSQRAASKPLADCAVCRGKGKAPCWSCTGKRTVVGACPTCAGRGGISKCDRCKGSGRVACVSCRDKEPARSTCESCLKLGRLPCEGCKGVLDTCSACKGAGESEQPCLVCSKTGQVACPDCAQGDDTRVCGGCQGTRRVACEGCTGTGLEPVTCFRCKGKGLWDCPACQPGQPGRCGRCGRQGVVPCADCLATGNQHPRPCGSCGGSGALPCATCAAVSVWRGTDPSSGAVITAFLASDVTPTLTMSLVRGVVARDSVADGLWVYVDAKAASSAVAWEGRMPRPTWTRGLPKFAPEEQAPLLRRTAGLGLRAAHLMWDFDVAKGATRLLFYALECDRGPGEDSTVILPPVGENPEIRLSRENADSREFFRAIYSSK